MLVDVNDTTERQLVHQMEHWGFELLDPHHAHSPGFGRLLVAMRSIPTRQHYDPEAIHLHLINADGAPVAATLHQETPVHLPQRVAPGAVIVTDRYDKQLSFFTYGGSIECVVVPDESIYSLGSSAPVLPLNGGLDEDLAEQLAAETEALFAKIHVGWGTDDAGFARRMAQIEASQLYAATIVSLKTAYDRSAALRHAFPAFYKMVCQERNWLVSGQSPEIDAHPLERMAAPV